MQILACDGPSRSILGCFGLCLPEFTKDKPKVWFGEQQRLRIMSSRCVWYSQLLSGGTVFGNTHELSRDWEGMLVDTALCWEVQVVSPFPYICPPYVQLSTRWFGHLIWTGYGLYALPKTVESFSAPVTLTKAITFFFICLDFLKRGC